MQRRAHIKVYALTWQECQRNRRKLMYGNIELLKRCVSRFFLTSSIQKPVSSIASPRLKNNIFRYLVGLRRSFAGE
jgi:hypothetical protein